MTADQRRDVVAQSNPEYNAAYDSKQHWGVGGDYSRALQAVTTIVVGGVSGQSAGQVATNALAPYAAQLIGKTFDPNHGSNPNAALQLVSHAVLGAVLAEVNGSSAGSGALAGASGELAAKYLTQTLYGDDPRAIDPVTGKFNPNLLPEQDKQMLVALSQAVGAIAGGLAGGSLLDAGIGAQIAGNAVTNNAMLSVDEVARIKEIANCDPEKEKRLLAAACSKKKCANGLNSNDPYYAIWSALQTEGDKPEYQDEKDWLSWQSQPVKYYSGSFADTVNGAQVVSVPLFTYTSFDALADWSSRNNVGTRTLGGLQMLGGATEVAGAFVAAPICTTGWGCFAVGYVAFSGADNAIGGSKTLFGGVPTPTLGGQALQMLGLSEDRAELVYGLTQLGAGVKAGNDLVGNIGGIVGDKVDIVQSFTYLEEPPFNPAGSAGAAQAWSMKGRIKYVELPSEGRIRYVPPKSYDPSSPLPRGPNNGYLDKFGNEWVKGPSRTAGQAFEWDVQLSRQGKAQLGWATRDGSHLNVSLDGRVTHK
nr:polymorphic toxin type 17 domain-containing protein [Xanthomonas euvesicatoria]